MDISLGPNGVDRWFTKPLNPKALLEALRDELEHPNAFLRKLAMIRLVGSPRRLSHGFGTTDPHGADLLVAG